MDIFKDYANWYEDNKMFIEELIHRESILIERIIDVIKVLEYIYMHQKSYEKIEEELTDIFDVGFGYIHEQISDLKHYYQSYFYFDFEKMEEYAQLINYSLYLDDFKEALYNAEKENKEVFNEFEKIQEEIDKIIINSEPFDDDLFDRLDHKIALIFDNTENLKTIPEIFSIVSEDLEL